MSLAGNKIILANSSANTAGSYLQPVTVSSIGSGNATTMTNAQFIPAGLYLWPQSASNVVIEVNTYNGANNWVTLIANNVGGTFFSDGYNVRANAATGTQSIILWTPNGGNAVVGQYYNV